AVAAVGVEIAVSAGAAGTAGAAGAGVARMPWGNQWTTGIRRATAARGAAHATVPAGTAGQA
ncbi:hypothetical protein OSI81_25580, partial [Mycobacterium ulcerans]